MPIPVNNTEFLTTIFGDQAHRAHVSNFFDAPDNIIQGRRGICWAGGAFGEYQLAPGSNQYFCISLFDRPTGEPSRRRKSLFQAAFCIVLDDVREKLDRVVAEQLPPPSWILETSPGSEQWGYLLTEPEISQARIDNLHDILIGSKLAPDSTDPGQRGVTRYVRLPEGSNRKLKWIDGAGNGYRCQMLTWNPGQRVRLEDLVAPFGGDLDRPRDDIEHTVLVGTDGSLAAYHPALEYIQVKSKLGDGKYDITCPWVHEHTGGDDSGTAIFLMGKGKLGFQCHHGHCQDRTWADVERALPSDWMFEGVTGGVPSKTVHIEQAIGMPAGRMLVQEVVALAEGLSIEDKPGKETVIREAAQMDVLDRDLVKAAVSESRCMSAKAYDAALKAEIKRLEKTRIEAKRAQFAIAPVAPGGSMSVKPDERYVFIAADNAFWDLIARQFTTREGINGRYGASAIEDQEKSPAQALLEYCPKADRTTYHPGEPPGVTDINSVRVLNTWRPGPEVRISGGEEPNLWLTHVRGLVPADRERETLLDWMAWTLQHPGKKSNWQVLLAGYQGSGKDTLMAPLKIGVGLDNLRQIPASYLLEPYEDYLLCKLLVIQEVENFEKRKVENKLKRILAQNSTGGEVEPLIVRRFGQKHMVTPNLIQCVFMSNHRSSAMQISRDDRRVFAIWSDLKPDNSAPWKRYFRELHAWLDDTKGGTYPHGYGMGLAVDYLLRRDVRGFDAFGRAPDTEFKDHLIESNKSSIELTLLEGIDERSGPFQFDLVKMQIVIRWLEQERQLKANMNGVGRIFTRLGFTKYHDSIKSDGAIEQQRYWAIRNTEKWEAETGRGRLDAFEKNGIKKLMFTGLKPVR